MTNERISELARARNYLLKIPFLFVPFIWEYDIRKANINMLLAYGIINQDQYNTYLNYPKLDREIAIGNLIRSDKKIQKYIDRGITDAKYRIMKIYTLDPNKILRIANDAIYIMSPYQPFEDVTRVPINNDTYEVEFVLKNRFSYYINFNIHNILFFFSLGDDNGYDVDIKGIGNEKLFLHEKFISAICSILVTYEYAGKQSAIDELKEFYNRYINKELDVEYYREFNSFSGYRISTNYETFISNNPFPMDHIDINFNLNLLRTLYSYLLMS